MPALLSFNEDALVYTILAAFQAPPPTKNGGETQGGIAISSGTKIIQRQSHTHTSTNLHFSKSYQLLQMQRCFFCTPHQLLLPANFYNFMKFAYHLFWVITNTKNKRLRRQSAIIKNVSADTGITLSRPPKFTERTVRDYAFREIFLLIFLLSPFLHALLSTNFPYRNRNI